MVRERGGGKEERAGSQGGKNKEETGGGKGREEVITVNKEV